MIILRPITLICITVVQSNIYQVKAMDWDPDDISAYDCRAGQNTTPEEPSIAPNDISKKRRVIAQLGNLVVQEEHDGTSVILTRSDDYKAPQTYSCDIALEMTDKSSDGVSFSFYDDKEILVKMKLGKLDLFDAIIESINQLVADVSLILQLPKEKQGQSISTNALDKYTQPD